MTSEEALAAADRLMELFPNMQPEQHAALACEFETHNAADVKVAIDRHYLESGGGFVKPESLMSYVRLAERGRKIREDSERRRREDEECRRQISRRDQIISVMSDTELEIRKAEVLSHLPDGRAKTVLQVRDPRKSPWLKALICERASEEKLAGAL